MAERTHGHLDTAPSMRDRNFLERSTAHASLMRLPILRILVLSTARSVLYSGQGVLGCCISVVSRNRFVLPDVRAGRTLAAARDLLERKERQIESSVRRTDAAGLGALHKLAIRC